MSGPGRWLIVSVPAPPRGEERLLVDALRRAGARLVEQEGERFIAQLRPAGPAGRLLAEVEAAVRASTSLIRMDIGWRWLDEAEWEARWAREVGAVRVTERIVVVPAGPGEETIRRTAGSSTQAPEGATAPIVIRLAPGLAFGTAEHPTTRSCLRLLERTLAPGDRVLDVGAGTGILSIAAARLGARRVLALESEPDSVATAIRNTRINEVADRVTVRRAVVSPRSPWRLRRVDGVLANVHAGVVIPLLHRFARILARDGWIIASGLLPAEREDALSEAGGARLKLEASEQEDGWWTALFRPAKRNREMP